ncbi:hypothetical protein BMR47_26765 [Escherichia coli]|nr:hypothetical protein BMR47_26765 [Escherichia coli]PNC07435.1 hypothetical protein CK476_23640 [Escherichia coli]
MTLGTLLALCKSFSMQKSTVLCANAAKRVKKQQTEKKIKKVLVQKIGIPIMRLHRHGGCESLHTNSRFG